MHRTGIRRGNYHRKKKKRNQCHYHRSCSTIVFKLVYSLMTQLRRKKMNNVWWQSLLHKNVVKIESCAMNSHRFIERFLMNKREKIIFFHRQILGKEEKRKKEKQSLFGWLCVQEGFDSSNILRIGFVRDSRTESFRSWFHREKSIFRLEFSLGVEGGKQFESAVQLVKTCDVRLIEIYF